MTTTQTGEPWRHIDLEIEQSYDPVFVRVGPAGIVVEVMLHDDNEVGLNIYDAADAAADKLDAFWYCPRREDV